MGSEDYGAGNVPGDENSSLAARRARLRGTLSKQAVPPDPYTPDPYMQAAINAPAPTPNNGNENEIDHEESGNGNNGAGASPAITQAAAPSAVAYAEDDMANNTQVQDPADTVENPADSGRVDRRKQPQLPSGMPPAVMQNLSNAIANTSSFESYSAANESETMSRASADDDQAPVAAMPPAPTSYNNYQLAPPIAPPLTQAVMPPSPFAPLSSPIMPGRNGQEESEPLPQPPMAEMGSTDYTFGILQPSLTPVAMPTVQPEIPAIQSQAFEVLTNIDQAMGACAMNLSELQKIASEQTEALRALAQTLQNQSFFEIGLNLNSLMESLSAALEPMKAVGELVPAIDQLVTVMEARETAAAEDPKLTRDQLVTSLADQLSAGIIDPWTFKCAYIAVYPTDHPADLLHRLVDLLGTQRLSGELFRAAYDAVQAADPVKSAAAGEENIRTVVKVVQDETLLAQIEALKATNDEFRSQQGDVQKLIGQKESEFAQHIAAKEKELQEAQELLNSRYEEFNSRYDQLTETLHKRDEALHEKEADVTRKESENGQLRSQIQELRDQMREMAELLSSKPKEQPPAPQPQQIPAPPQPAAKPAGFFDVAPNQPQQQQPQHMFDPSRAPQAPMNPMDQLQQNLPQPQQQQPMMQQQQPIMQQQQAGQPAPPQPTNQAVPKAQPQTTPFAGAAGSYGSGVRAQVFEVIVRQALAGAPWREICAGPMQVNNISPEEVEAEVKRRQAMLKK